LRLAKPAVLTMGANEKVAQNMVEAPKAADGVDASSRALPGLVLAFRFQSNGAAEELTVDKLAIDQADGWSWLHFDLSVPGSTEILDSLADMPEPARELLKAHNEQQQLYTDDACTYGVFVDLLEDLDETADEIVFVQFAMTERLFVSSSRSRLGALASLPEVVRNRNISGSVEFLTVIVEYVINSVARYAVRLVKDLDDIEEKMLSDESSNERRLITQIRRTAVRLHRQIAVSRSLIQRIERDDAGNRKLSLRSAAESLGQRIDWLNTEIEAVRERAHLLQEEAMLKTADETNSHLQVLSIVATVFLPATLIAGIFGMNVKGLPLTENGNGFLWAMVLLIGATGLIFSLLTWSGVLRK
jgi:zinc transporter